MQLLWHANLSDHCLLVVTSVDYQRSNYESPNVQYIDFLQPYAGAAVWIFFISFHSFRFSKVWMYNFLVQVKWLDS